MSIISTLSSGNFSPCLCLSVVLLSCALHQIKNSCICRLCCHVKDSGGKCNFALFEIHPGVSAVHTQLWFARLVVISFYELNKSTRRSTAIWAAELTHSNYVRAHAFMNSTVRTHVAVCVVVIERLRACTFVWLIPRNILMQRGCHWALRKSNTTVMLGNDPSRVKRFYRTRFEKSNVILVKNCSVEVFPVNEKCMNLN